ncbi:hypothetical protein NG796_13100 [Laspinema sp. A4]|uniref:hypothetical protein n=1 Tax=Laspinema sp. D2d TaxID=2953686 RepID=UPI0021BAE092|nr:hypothetical protein [Laspinema sp. D2d]MCT7984233.1 hypothetical protein [Laspinema sp. D2d]
MKLGSSLAQYGYWARLLSQGWFWEEVAGDFPLLERSPALMFAMDFLRHLNDYRSVQFRQLQFFIRSSTPCDRRFTLPSTPTMGGYFFPRF